MNKLGKRRFILSLLILCSFLFVACQKEEVYTPVKKTGEEAPPIELPLLESEKEEKEEEVKEKPKEEPKEVKTSHDFSKQQVFKVAPEEIIVRQRPSIDAEIIKYFAQGEELIVVDKVKGEDGEQWYAVRLFDYDLTYGFTAISNLSYVKEIQVETEKTTEGETESNEE